MQHQNHKTRLHQGCKNTKDQTGNPPRRVWPRRGTPKLRYPSSKSSEKYTGVSVRGVGPCRMIGRRSPQNASQDGSCYPLKNEMLNTHSRERFVHSNFMLTRKTRFSCIWHFSRERNSSLLRAVSSVMYTEWPGSQCSRMQFRAGDNFRQLAPGDLFQ